MLTRNVFIEKHGDLLFAKKAKKPMIAIRLFCAECCGMSRYLGKIEYPIEEIKKCPDKMCPLWEWRSGRNPYPSKSRVERGKKLFQRRQVELSRK